MRRILSSTTTYRTNYLCGGACIRLPGLPPGHPPGQRARVASAQLSWLWFLGGDELHQLDEQPLRQLLLPLWTQGLLPLQQHGGRQRASFTKSESTEQRVVHAELNGSRSTEALSPAMVCSSQASWTLVLLVRTSGCLQEYLQVTSTTCIKHMQKYQRWDRPRRPTRAALQ